MSAYLRLGSRLLILSILMLMVVLSRPKPAFATSCFVCRSQCINQEHSCIISCDGDSGCESVCQDGGNACLADCGC